MSDSGRPESGRRGVLFDATGTLFEARAPVGDVYHRVACEHGVDLPAWRLEDAFRRILRHAPPRGTAGATPEARREGEIDWWFERIRQTFQATDSTARFADFDAFAQSLFDAYRGADAWRIRPGIREILDDLQTRQVPMAVVSNFDHRLPDLLEALEIHHFFDHILLPAEIGAAKPDRALFDAAAVALGLPLEALLYVGDDDPAALEQIAEWGLQVVDIEQTPAGPDLQALLRGALA